jgi:DNA-binding MarR family transcriptional regulator
MIAECEQVFRDAEERLLQGFSPEERNFLKALLPKALQHL